MNEINKLTELFCIVVSSDCFVNHLFSTPETSDYHCFPNKDGSCRCFPNKDENYHIALRLMACNRELRANIRSRAPEWFRVMTGILSGIIHKPQPCGGGIKNYQNGREIITKLYKSGVLTRYLDCIPRIKYRFPVVRELSEIPPECAREWTVCGKYLSDVPSRRSTCFAKEFPEYDDPDSVSPGNLFATFTQYLWVASESYAEFILHKKNKSIITTLAPVLSVTHMTTKYTTRSGMVDKEYALSELPVRGHALNSYFLIIWNNPGDFGLIRRFYDRFRARMPTTGAWDLLLFCSLFDLELREMTD